MATTADFGPPAEAPEIPGDPLALERQVCFALSVATRSVLSVYRPILERMGLTHPQYLVMLALWGPAPPAGEVVTRTRAPDDERQLRIDLTQKGRALRAEALNVPPAVVAKLGMSLGDLEELHKGLTTLNEAARRAGGKALPTPSKDSV